MKKILLLSTITFLLFSCSKKVEEEIVPVPVVPETLVTINGADLIGNWYITKIINLALPTGKSPKNATVTVPAFSSFLGIETNGKSVLSNIGISNNGLDPFTKGSFGATYTIDKNIFKLIVDINSKKYINYFKVKSVTPKELVLFQDKALYIKALEENKTTIGETTYKADLAIYNENDRYESEITLLK
jgi:hypothetical protein